MVNLTGTFQINSQQNDSAIGQANLTGTLNDQPVQYLIGFTGTGDDDGNVTATLSSIVFKSLTSPLTGTGTGSLTGTLDGRTLVANVSGQFSGPLVGTCVFTGTLTAQAQTSFSLITGTGLDNLSSFGFGFTPADPVFPAGPRGGGAQFEVFFDSDYPDPSTVRITGPAGSNITNKIPEDSDIGGDHARYRVGNNDRGNLPGGTWTVLYKGQTKTFTLPPFNANASFVVVFPTVTVDADDNLISVSWIYRDRLSGATIGAPSFMAGIGVRVDSQTSGDQPRSAILSPSVTSFTLADAGFTNVKWSSVNAIKFTYTDLVGHLYEQSYSKALSVQLQPNVRIEYNDFGPACVDGCLTRQLQVFVNTQTGLVKNKTSCPRFAGGGPAQSGPPFFVQIQNHDAATTGSPNPSLPFNTPDCVNYSFTGSFGDSITVDSFSDFVDLDTAGDTGGPVTLVPGTKFDVSVSTDPTDPTASRQTVVVPLVASEADPVNDVIRLTVPSGFRLANVLNRATTISWTPPSFAVAQLFVNPNVYVASSGPGFLPFCSLQTNELTNPPAGTTQATFTLPSTCNGKPVIQANVCVQYTGLNGETSSGCWFWRP
jgi:hypothetical protein